MGLANDFPGVTIICDHCGCPTMVGSYKNKRDEIFAQWKLDMAELAKCPNVVVKVGGMTMPYSGFGWELRDAPPSSAELAEGLAPWYMFLVETFGPERCMFVRPRFVKPISSACASCQLQSVQLVANRRLKSVGG